LGFIPSGLPRSEDAEDPQRLNAYESGTPSFDDTLFNGTQGIRLVPVDTSRLAARSFIRSAEELACFLQKGIGPIMWYWRA